jgi:hypothetical protein
VSALFVADRVPRRGLWSFEVGGRGILLKNSVIFICLVLFRIDGTVGMVVVCSAG